MSNVQFILEAILSSYNIIIVVSAIIKCQISYHLFTLSIVQQSCFSLHYMLYIYVYQYYKLLAGNCMSYSCLENEETKKRTNRNDFNFLNEFFFRYSDETLV